MGRTRRISLFIGTEPSESRNFSPQLCVPRNLPKMRFGGRRYAVGCAALIGRVVISRIAAGTPLLTSHP